MLKVCECCRQYYTPGKFLFKRQRYCQECIKDGVARKLSIKKYDVSEKGKLKKKGWIERNRDRVRAIKQKYANSTKGKLHKKEYRIKTREHRHEYMKKYWRETKSRTIAHNKYRRLFPNPKCSECNLEEDVHIHHKDFNVFNNDIENLIPLCCSCHLLLHKWVKNIPPIHTHK